MFSQGLNTSNLSSGNSQSLFKRTLKAVVIRRRRLITTLLTSLVFEAIFVIVASRSLHALTAAFEQQHCRLGGYIGGKCVALEGAINSASSKFSLGLVAAGAIPVVLLVFSCAPLLASEYESGTFRFTWTQEAGRRRLVAADLLILSLVAVSGTLLISLCANWTFDSLDRLGFTSHWRSYAFNFAPAILTSFAVLTVCGTFLVGALLKKVVPSVVASFVVAIGFFAATIWRVNYFYFSLLSKETVVPTRMVRFLALGGINERVDFSNSWMAPQGSWVVKGWISTAQGRVLDSGRAMKSLVLFEQHSGNPQDKFAPAKWLQLHHFQYWLATQNRDNFWNVQLSVAALYLAISALLVFLIIKTIERSHPTAPLRSSSWRKQTLA